MFSTSIWDRHSTVDKEVCPEKFCGLRFQQFPGVRSCIARACRACTSTVSDCPYARTSLPVFSGPLPLFGSRTISSLFFSYPGDLGV